MVSLVVRGEPDRPSTQSRCLHLSVLKTCRRGLDPTKGEAIKQCWRCRVSYDADGFYTNLTKADSLSDECRSCAREMARERYYRDIESSRARSREVRAHRRERALATQHA